MLHVTNFFHRLLPSDFKNKAKELLEDVLAGDEDKVIDMAKENPELFFIPATANDLVSDLEGNRRTITNYSPFQAIFGAEDNVMLSNIKPLLEKFFSSHPEYIKKALDQLNAKFLNDNNNDLFDFDPLMYALKKREIYPNRYDAESKRFKNFFAVKAVTAGKHFNVKNLVNAFRVYNEYNLSNEDRAIFYQSYICYLARFLPTCYAQAVCQGLLKAATGEPLTRGLELDTQYKNWGAPHRYYANDNIKQMGVNLVIDFERGEHSMDGAYVQYCPVKCLLKICEQKRSYFSDYKDSLLEMQNQHEFSMRGPSGPNSL